MADEKRRSKTAGQPDRPDSQKEKKTRFDFVLKRSVEKVHEWGWGGATAFLEAAEL